MRDPQRAIDTASQLRLDREAERVFDVLDAAGVDAVLLKGAAFARHLYDPGEPRRSVDVDVLVAPDAAGAAAAALEAAGMADDRLHTGAILEGRHARELADERVLVDLHHTVVGAGAAPADVWRVFRAGATPMTLRTREVLVPSPACLALHAALHASWSGHDETRPWEDARRAAARLDAAVWDEASALARELRAVPGFVAGLRASEEGRGVLAGLGLSPRLALGDEVLMQLPPTVAYRLVRLGTTPGLRAKARFVARELRPPAERLAVTGDGGAGGALARRRLAYALRRLPSAAGDTVRGVRAARRRWR